MLRCAEGDLDAEGWRVAAQRDYTEVMNAAATLAPAPALRRCAEQGFEGVLASDSASDIYRANALLGIHTLRLGQGLHGDVRRLAATEEGKRFHLDWLFLLEAAAGIGFGPEAAELARAQGSDFQAMSSPLLWGRGTWEARRGDPEAAAAIASILDSRADSNGLRRDRLLADVVAAHASLATGDTTRAQGRLAALEPVGNLKEITWSLWDPLGFERLTLAEILLAQRNYPEAIRVASLLDAPAPIVYLLYRPRSLQLRLAAARELGDRDLIRMYEARLSALGQPRIREADDRRSEPEGQGGATW
jgi:hypothetical protein